ncbi:MAG: ACT domain-containing protein [Clostridia bacterium]|nr:ACT domain-containing protein [Clostridia bacterium]
MKTKAVISVTGKDNVGIIAKVSNVCADYGANIVDISQTVLKEYFAMIMLVEIDSLTVPFTEFVDYVAEIGKQNGLEIHAMHEDIFDSMHRI